MSFISVAMASLAALVFGAIWYSIFAKSWSAASDVTLDENGKPTNWKRPLPYIIGILCAVIVAATMHYAFNMLDIVTPRKGFTSGLGIGACFAAPWIATNYGLAGKPLTLIVIDGGYAILGSAIIGTVLTLI
ncbi:DUF1761 domain-containing protein [Marivita sp. S0852]|uniref:DUF1761 domain-containing protein n=1 Tax=Marivita sp. S0852 TaxID=3373893 RepID=UPI003981F008